MSISFYLLRKNAPSSSIMITICFHGIIFKAATGLTCSPKNWSFKYSRVKKSEKNYQFINRAIIDYTHYLNEALISYELSEKTYNMDDLRQIYYDIKSKIIVKKNKLDANSENNDETNQNELLKHFQQFIAIRSEDPNFSDRIVKNYKNCYNHLRRFLLKKGIDLQYDNIDNTFYTKYLNYLSYDLNLQRNTVGNIIKTFKTFLNWSLDEGYHTNTRFIKVLKVWKEKSDTIALDDSDIKRIEEVDLSGNEKLSKARDIFLICLFTGFRYGDYNKIQPAHINLERGDIRLVTNKTKDAVGIPIDSRLKKIIEKYPDLQLPKMSNQKVNNYIKEVAKSAGLTENVIKRYTIGNKVEEVTLPKYELISMHTARRTWITKAEKTRRNSFAIMRATGHKNVNVHSGYVKFDLDDAIEEMRGMWE